MIYKKGKWQAGYKDTWCVQNSLSPIIAAWLKRFIEVSKDPDKITGIPSESVSSLGIVFDNEEDKLAWGERHKEWIETLEKMLYAFETKPDLDIPDGLYDGYLSNKGPLHSKPELLEQYELDCEEHKRKREEGLKLMFKNWDSLWW